MTTTRQVGIALALVTALAVGCGGSDGDGGTVGNGGGDGSGIATGALVTGVVSGGSQVVVNGISYSTAGAVYRQDDSPDETLGDDSAGRARLKDGMVVTVRGEDDGARGRASEIEFRPDMAGLLDDQGGSWITVSGRDLSVDDSTRYYDASGNPTSQAGIGRGTRVEVSGFPDDRGGLRVSYVRVKPEDDGAFEIEVKGFVVSVNGTVVAVAGSAGGAPFETFDVGGLSGVALPDGPPAVGWIVEVKSAGLRTAGGALVATRLEREDRLGGQGGLRVHVEGLVASGTFQDFVIGGQRVVTNASTQLVGGVVDDFTAGTKVEVHGVLQQDGSLLASRVTFKASGRIEAGVTAVTTPAGAPTGFAEFTQLGRRVIVTSSTRVDDVSLGSLQGQCIETRGYAAANGTDLIATRVRTTSLDCSERVTLRGVVTAETPTSSLTILGIDIDTVGTSFRNRADQEIGATAFFDAVVPNQTVVKVRWRPASGATSAAVDEAELESP